MSTIVTRAGKGSPLTNTEVDSNFTNLNTDKYQSGDNVTFTDASLTGNVILSSTGAITLPSGTTAQQPGIPTVGMLRYNSELDTFEGYTTADGWGEIAGGLSESVSDLVILGNISGAGAVYQELTEDNIKSSFKFRSVYEGTSQPVGWVTGDFWIKT